MQWGERWLSHSLSPGPFPSNMMSFEIGAENKSELICGKALL